MADMTFFEAALKVLKDANGGPLHFRDIAKRAIDAEYITPVGKPI